MRGQRFRMQSPTLAIMSSDGHRMVVSVPQGAIVAVIDSRSDGNRLLNVECEGKSFMMFAVDLHQQGARIDGGGN
jgi:hypothetical protein